MGDPPVPGRDDGLPTDGALQVFWTLTILLAGALVGVGVSAGLSMADIPYEPVRDHLGGDAGDGTTDESRSEGTGAASSEGSDGDGSSGREPDTTNGSGDADGDDNATEGADGTDAGGDGTVRFALESSGTFGDFAWRGTEAPIEGDLDPSLNVTTGQPVELAVQHGHGADDTVPHKLEIRGPDGTTVATSEDLRPDETDGHTHTVTWTPDQPGAYTYVCTYHPEMEGRIQVAPAEAARGDPTATANGTGTVPGNRSADGVPNGTALGEAPPAGNGTGLPTADEAPGGPDEAGPSSPGTGPVRYALESSGTFGDFAWRGTEAPIEGDLDPSLSASVGQRVELVVEHGHGADDTVPHKLEVRGPDGTTVATSEDLRPDETDGHTHTVTWTPDQPGTYTYVCTYHPEMEGTITVQAAEAGPGSPANGSAGEAGVADEVAAQGPGMVLVEIAEDGSSSIVALGDAIEAALRERGLIGGEGAASSGNGPDATGSGGATGANGSQADAGGDGTVRFALESSGTFGDFAWRGTEAPIEGDLDPSLNVTTGQPVELAVQHGHGADDTVPHKLEVRGPDGTTVATSEDLRPDETDGHTHTVTWTPDQPGTYTYVCTYHPEMEGTITVGDGDADGEAAGSRGNGTGDGTTSEDSSNRTVSGGTGDGATNGTAYEGTTVRYTFEATDTGADLGWKGVGEPIDGQIDPSVEATLGDTVEITARHGHHPDDGDPHKFEIRDGSTTLAQSTELQTSDSHGEGHVVTWTPEATGTYTYICTYHPDMRGTITIREPGGAGNGSDNASANYTLSSHVNGGGDMVWLGESGGVEGQGNPTLHVGASETLDLTLIHGSQPGDDGPHQLEIRTDGDDFLGPVIETPGDEARILWTPPAPGEYEYRDEEESNMRGTIVVE